MADSVIEGLTYSTDAPLWTSLLTTPSENKPPKDEGGTGNTDTNDVPTQEDNTSDEDVNGAIGGAANGGSDSASEGENVPGISGAVGEDDPDAPDTSDSPDVSGPAVPPQDSDIPGTESNTGESDTTEMVGQPEENPEEKGGVTLSTGTAVLLGAVTLISIIGMIISLILAGKAKKAVSSPGKSIPSTSDLKKKAGYPEIARLHHVGDRDSQQDCFAVSPVEIASTHGVLAVVADGMGGLQNGDKVSQTAVAAMLDGFMSTEGDPKWMLLSLAAQANHRVNQLLGPGGIGKSGSTLTAAIIKDGQFHYISIGDSRISLFRDGQLIQLNREHIYLHELSTGALNGIGTLQNAANHPKAGGLTSYLGMGQLKYVDIPAEPVTIRPGDKFILMSDGVYNAMSRDELSRCLMNPAQEAAKQIEDIIAAKAYAHQDNYTAVILAC